MRTLAEVIGWVTLACALLGMLHIGMEFRYCFAPVGTCITGEPK